MKSSDCECKKLVKKKIDDRLPIGGQMIDVVNAPALVCEDCGEIQFDGDYILRLEREVKRQHKKAA